jgi:glycosyltransferase involved in cell wall biosynthesis
MTSPEFSVLIAWSNRDELRETLLKNDFWFKNHRLEVLVINCGGSVPGLRQLIQDTRLDYVQPIEVPSPVFNKCLALNIGIHASRAPILLMLDADIILQSDLLEESLPHLNEDAYVTLKTIRESEKIHEASPANQAISQSSAFLREFVKVDEIEFFWIDETSTKVTTHAYPLQNAKSAPGILVARKEHLLEIDGYNAEMKFWGWEDLDVLLRLSRTLRLRRVECGSAIHLTHDDSRRAIKGGENRVRTDTENFLLAWSRYSRGNFAGTYKDDIRSWSPVVDGFRSQHHTA